MRSAALGGRGARRPPRRAAGARRQEGPLAAAGGPGAPSPRGACPSSWSPAPDDRGRLRRLADARVAAEPDVYFPRRSTAPSARTARPGSPRAGRRALRRRRRRGVGGGHGQGDDEGALRAGGRAPGRVPRAARARRGGGAAPAVEASACPLFVKPANLGSSVGGLEGEARRGPRAALDLALAYDRKVVRGGRRSTPARSRSRSSATTPPRPRCPGEIVPDREFYDYDSKYSADSRTELRIPAPVGRARRRRASGSSPSGPSARWTRAGTRAWTSSSSGRRAASS